MSGMDRDDLAADKLLGRMARRAMGALLLAGSPFLALGFVLAEPSTAFGGHKLLVAAGIATLGLLGAGGLMAWAKRQPREPRVRDAVLRRIDATQRRRSVLLILIGFYALALTNPIWRAAGELIADTPRPISYIIMLSAFSLALVMASAIAGPLERKRALFDDEFSRALSIRALLTGLAVLAVGTLGLFALGVGYPLRAVQAMPLLLLYAVVIANFTYAICDLRADKGE